MKRIVLLFSRIVEIIVILASMLVCISYMLSGQDDFEFGMERIENITGYVFDGEKTELILHQTNSCDSIVMMSDARAKDVIEDQMNRLVATDDRWKCVQIAESNAYEVITTLFSKAYQTSQHFRPVCVIDRGSYDYLYCETEDDHIYGCLVDTDTGTIVLYIYLD